MISLSKVRTNQPAHPGTRRCLIVGAGRAGRVIARELRGLPEFGLAPVGFLDDQERWRVGGLPILGRLADFETVAEKRDVDVVVLAIPGLPESETQRLVDTAAAIGVSVRYLPSFLAVIERDARLADLRDLQVERLLGREERRLVRTASRSAVADKVVLVTGAGGSIGSELCRQIKAFGPRELYLLDHDESNLHTLQMELDGRALLDSQDVIIADIRDRDRIMQVFEDVRPEVVFHTAAHKHLPLLELHPCEGVKTNVLGTRNLGEAAVAAGTETFVNVSTDKAADPVSILGATKRLGEILLQRGISGGTRFASVRFGNVLGSRGSLLTVLGEQIRNGRTVTITHPDVTRFFMTIEEAAGLVVEAAGMADFGETFVLDMGEPVRIVDLTYKFAEQMHVSPDELTIQYTGLRPGEKLNEALFSEDEERISTAHPKIWATRSPAYSPEMDEQVERLVQLARENRSTAVRALLREILAEYRPELEGSAEPAMAAPYPDGF
jgi:FlaA1/EpsC-like NDP-sugar epimerase